MALWEQGKLNLDSPVQSYCPAFPQKQWPMTTRQLLGHLGGIRYYKAPEYPYTESQSDPEVGNTRHFENGIEGGMRFFASDPLVAQPGTHFNYSTQGYTLVGCVLEGATSQKYVDYVHENIFWPAGMVESQADDFFVVVPHRTRWYHKDEAGIVRNAGVLDSSYKIPGGGLISSADDMARFEAAILADRLMQRATRDLMWTSLKTADGKATGYGLGWGLSDKFGVHIFAHTGGQQGTSTAFALVPERRAGVVVLANMDNVDSGSLADQILKLVLDLKDKTP